MRVPEENGRLTVPDEDGRWRGRGWCMCLGPG